MKLSAQTLTTAVLLAGQAVAQTPPGFSPATKSTFGVKFGDVTVSSGNSVPLEKTTVSPALDFPHGWGNSSHVVIMVDLDASGGISNHPLAPFLHWLTPATSKWTSLPSNESVTDAFAPYIGPAPPVGTGPHRYVVLLFTDSNSTFQIPPSFKDLDPSNITQRAVFDIQKFADEGGFKLEAANWFTTENRTTVVPTAAAPSLTGGINVGLLSLAGLCGLAWGLF